MTSVDLAWNLYLELRKEVLSTQQVRARAIEFKITFVSTAIGLIAANLAAVDDRLLVLPAFAALLFDLLIISSSFAIKRKGAYARVYLEPILKEQTGWPSDVPLWESYMSLGAQRQLLSFVANVGISALTAVPGTLVLLRPPVSFLSVTLVAALVALLVYVAIAHGRLTYFIRLQR
jgi:hypothetical protein